MDVTTFLKGLAGGDKAAAKQRLERMRQIRSQTEQQLAAAQEELRRIEEDSTFADLEAIANGRDIDYCEDSIRVRAKIAKLNHALQRTGDAIAAIEAEVRDERREELLVEHRTIEREAQTAAESIYGLAVVLAEAIDRDGNRPLAETILTGLSIRPELIWQGRPPVEETRHQRYDQVIRELRSLGYDVDRLPGQMKGMAQFNDQEAADCIGHIRDKATQFAKAIEKKAAHA